MFRSLLYHKYVREFQVQDVLYLHKWNPGLRRRKEDAFEEQIAGKWHLITVQEASDYVDHDILQERFHVTHFAGCAILFNKDILPCHQG